MRAHYHCHHRPPLPAGGAPPPPRLPSGRPALQVLGAGLGLAPPLAPPLARSPRLQGRLESFFGPATIKSSTIGKRKVGGTGPGGGGGHEGGCLAVRGRWAVSAAVLACVDELLLGGIIFSLR